MQASPAEATQRIKQRLFDSIGAQVDSIARVPEDLLKLVEGIEFQPQAIGQLDAERAAVRLPARHAEATPAEIAVHVNTLYDHSFYSAEGITGLMSSDTQYRNIGYWDATTTNQHEASIRLQEALLAFIPEKTGRILDVACGMGASTRHLFNYYAPEDIWAINISEKQIESTRRNAPGCHAMVMNAVEMQFEDAFFDNLLCIEAAFHYEPRRRFLEDALRILKPGGRLVMSDVLFTSPERLEQFPFFPSARNHLSSVDDYRAMLLDIGFSDVIVDDVSDHVWKLHFLYTIDQAHRAFLDGKINLVRLTEILWAYYLLHYLTGPNLFVSARK